jgi:hypothetical protein
MPKFPQPPAVAKLRAVSPALVTLASGTLLWRLYFQGGRHPTQWGQFRSYGPTGSRFDHHPRPPQVHGSHSILYAAQDGSTCFAEVFQESRLIDRTSRDPWLVGFELTRDVSLLDLTGTWPTRAGASMNLNSGPRPRAQLWSQRIHAAYLSVEGLYYPSSMYANQPSVALFERALSAMPAAPQMHRSLADPALHIILQNVASDIGYGLI